MRDNRVQSEAEWHVLSARRAELYSWLQQLRVELDTRSGAEELLARFDDLAKEYKEIELRLAH